MKDPEPSNVLGSSLEPTDAPVVTSTVSIGASGRAVDAIGSFVEEAFDAYADRLKGFARAAVHDDDAADDIVQEAFLRLVREIRRGTTPTNVGGWLFRVCANLITSRGRRRSVAERMKALLVNRAVAPPPEVAVVAADEAARLRVALDALPVDARVALLMAAEGFSSAEIGDAIGRTPGATATYLSRVRVRLRERLSDAEGRDD